MKIWQLAVGQTAFAHREQLREPEKFKAWLLRILVNTCYEQLRRQRRTVELSAVEDTLTAPGQDPTESISLWQAVLALPEPMRCVVTLFYDPATRTAGVAHAGWRGMAAGILPKTVEVMAEKLGAKRESLIAVLGPSIRQECFETDADVPEAMERLMGERVHPFIAEKGVKFHVDLQGIGVRLLTDAGLSPENVIDSGICTKCCADEFWSHRATHGHRGVQGGIICL